MRNFVIRIFVNALALSAADFLMEGITLIGGFWSVLLVALLFGIVNALLKPILLLLSFPFLVLSLGLFAFVVNGALLLITDALTERLEVEGLWAAILGSVIVSLVTIVLGAMLRDRGERKA